ACHVTPGLSTLSPLVGALGHGRLADGKWLRLGRLLPRLLRHGALLDADQGFAVRAVQDVDPARGSGFGNALAPLAVYYRVEEYHWARGIIVPDVVVNLLKVPHILAGLRFQGDPRAAKRVIARAHVPVFSW